jgi:CO/xanthine dehydrogenase Mo-binding subunit
MDMIAQTLGMDPIKLRLKNAVEEGDLMPDGTTFPRIGFKETLHRMADYLKHKGRMEGENRGRGIACGFWRRGVGSFSANVNINSDGTVNLVVGSTDISGSRTTLAQIVAEELCLSFDAISVVSGDMDTAPYGDMSVGSRTLLCMGIAVKRACHNAIVQLSRVASRRLGMNVSEIGGSKGIFQVKGNPQQSIAFPVLAKCSIVLRGEGPICGRASFGSTPFAPFFCTCNGY